MSHESNPPSSGSAKSAEQDLQRRLALALPEFTTRGFLFSSLLKSVQELGEDEALVRRCLEASGERSFVEFFHYPTRSLVLLLSHAAQALRERCGGFEEALWQIGFRSAESLMGTLVGRAAQQHGGEPSQRLMLTLQSLYGDLTNYGKPAVSSMGRDRGVISLHRTHLPLAYHEGSTQAISRRSGLVPVSVRARETGSLSIDLEISW